MVDVSSLTNDELREELIKFGDNPGPVVGEYRHGHLKFSFNLSKAGKTSEFYKILGVNEVNNRVQNDLNFHFHYFLLSKHFFFAFQLF